MAATFSNPAPFSSGDRLLKGEQVDAQLANLTVCTGDGLTALGTTQLNGLQLFQKWNNITSAAASTGVILPPSQAGQSCIVFNDGGNNITVYGNGTDTIDGTAGATGVTLSNTHRCEFYCLTSGKWLSALLGAVSS